MIVIPIEGVLRKPIGGQRNDSGYQLYRALSSTYQVLFFSEETDRTKVEDWLYKEGFRSYADIVMGDHPGNATDTRWTNLVRYLQHFRAYVLDMVVVNEPEAALEVLERGVPVLMYSQPAYGLPEWLPGSRRGAQRWADLSAKVEADTLARMDDKRMELPE